MFLCGDSAYLCALSLIAAIDDGAILYIIRDGFDGCSIGLLMLLVSL